MADRSGFRSDSQRFQEFLNNFPLDEDLFIKIEKPNLILDSHESKTRLTFVNALRYSETYITIEGLRLGFSNAEGFNIEEDSFEMNLIDLINNIDADRLIAQGKEGTTEEFLLD